MIETTIDCPFSIGDTVYIHETKDEYHEIECPFCHGDVTRDTGLMQIDYPRKMYYRKEDERLSPWILTCKTCEGTGVVQSLARHVDTYKKGILKGIHNFHGGGWAWIEYEVDMISEDGTIIPRVFSSASIYTEEKYKKMVENGQVDSNK